MKPTVANDIPFQLTSAYSPKGDQPQAIQKLVANIQSGERFHLLHGVTGTGKTFTIANVIQQLKRPALVIAPNKTLAAQLYHEFKEFFPSNRVRYFVSYYDYYQPEAYIPSTDTYIEKDSAINEEIDRMRHSATKALLESRDSVIVASVSCIYGLGAPEEYFNLMLFVEVGNRINRTDLIKKLVELQYLRTDIEFKRGSFRVRGESVDIFPSDRDESAYRILFFGSEIERITEIDPLTGLARREVKSCAVYPVSHFVTNKDAVNRGVARIAAELENRLVELRQVGKIAEAERLEQRTRYDIELLLEIGFCRGVENYSRHLAGRGEGEPPTTLLDYFPKDFLLFVDESHVTVPQIGAMYKGDRARKTSLVEYGFRLPSALDNRPLNGDEFWARGGQTIFVTATPGEYERQAVKRSFVVEQINRPTGVLDPQVVVKPAKNQIDDLISEIRDTVAKGHRVLVTTLTKKMAERLSEYFRELNIRSRYLHSDITTPERVEILRGLRKGDFDVLIGINLLREGLDLVEVALVAILDADKEGFLRSSRSLIQTMGRAARNLEGRVILYADRITDSMRLAIDETDRRRGVQREFNELHGIIPFTPTRQIEGSLVDSTAVVAESIEALEVREDVKKYLVHRDDAGRMGRELQKLRSQMFDAAAKREFEEAARIRDLLADVEKALLEGG